jgi:hypothetical protein
MLIPEPPAIGRQETGFSTSQLTVSRDLSRASSRVLILCLIDDTDSPNPGQCTDRFTRLQLLQHPPDRSDMCVQSQSPGIYLSGNPCYGELSIQIGLPGPCPVELLVFDITGQAVEGVSESSQKASIPWPSLVWPRASTSVS